MIIYIIAIIFSHSYSFANSDVYKFPSSKIDSIHVKNTHGNINIAVAAGDQTVLVTKKDLWSGKCHLDTSIQKRKLNISVEDRSWLPNHKCIIQLIVAVAEKTPILAHSATGDVNISGVTGEIDAKVGVGHLVVRADVEKLNALSERGDIRIEGTAKQMNLQSGAGDIEMVVFEPPETATYKLQTGTGDVQIFLPPKTRVLSKILSGAGTVQNEFEQAKNPQLTFDIKSGTGQLNLRKSTVH